MKMSTKKASNPEPPKDRPKPPPPPPPPLRHIKEGTHPPPSGCKVLRVGSIVKYNKRRNVVIGIEDGRKKVVRMVRLYKNWSPRLLSVKYLYGKMIEDLELLEE
jgi:hypothetical protein